MAAGLGGAFVLACEISTSGSKDFVEELARRPRILARW
jgi:hypothetical protein